MKKTIFFGLSFLLFFFETADLQSYCGCFLVICQLCYRFLIKIEQISLQWKDEIFWSVFFTVFFRLPIYESIAAIFWQSASYVYN